ncbi:YCII-like protein [Penicillium maclennaniae]|uniref:YCII-like protein n=1 Tax=Penicillium maclennaniae TaxID=1343394 RepID=UPI002540113E|nr:YCII-like protein [Penicillium maclennaniae]KAJ5665729.1 YCII-like protein [Penicillium maclennaniae]
MSSAPTKKEFLCILPDKPGMQAKRLEVRLLTLSLVSSLLAPGIGAMLEAHPADGETPSFKGSMLLALAESEAEVRALLEKDVYVSNGVWDMEKAQIIPFKSAVREQLKL